MRSDLMLNLDNKKFVAVENTANGEVSSQTEFHYHQQGKMIWAEYGGGEILKGFLIGKWIDDTQIEFTYQHLNQSLTLLSDRQNPDYRNSIKESISAVESICKIITQDDKATLGKALKIIEDKHGLHAALKGSLSQLYGYTSDADGIRHAMSGESNLSYIDAKFMLVACTNFINYLIEKAK